MKHITCLALPLMLAATGALAQNGTGLAPGAMSGAGTGLAPGGGGLAAPVAGPAAPGPGLSGPVTPQVLASQPPILPYGYYNPRRAAPAPRPK